MIDPLENVAKAVAADSEPESEEEAAPVAPAVDESSEDGVGGLDASAGEVDDNNEDDDDGDETDSPIVKRRSGGSAFALLGGDEDEDEDEDEESEDDEPIGKGGSSAFALLMGDDDDEDEDEDEDEDSDEDMGCLLYTSPSPRDVEESRMPSSA